MSEYARRNLLVCSAVGAHANTGAALKRLRSWKHPPLWLIDALEGIEARTEPLAHDLAMWRDQLTPTVGSGEKDV